LLDCAAPSVDRHVDPVTARRIDLDKTAHCDGPAEWVAPGDDRRLALGRAASPRLDGQRVIAEHKANGETLMGGIDPGVARTAVELGEADEARWVMDSPRRVEVAPDRQVAVRIHAWIALDRVLAEPEDRVPAEPGLGGRVPALDGIEAVVRDQSGTGRGLTATRRR
jgi:hypothetical protein